MVIVKPDGWRKTFLKWLIQFKAFANYKGLSPAESNGSLIKILRPLGIGYVIH